MIDWLNRITVTCFFASYALAWVLEVVRIFFLRTPRLWAPVAGLAAAGCLAQTLFSVAPGGRRTDRGNGFRELV